MFSLPSTRVHDVMYSTALWTATSQKWVYLLFPLPVCLHVINWSFFPRNMDSALRIFIERVSCQNCSHGQPGISAGLARLAARGDTVD